MDRTAYWSMRDTEDHHWWFVARRRIIRRLLEREVAKPAASTRILEAGCGYGGNLRLLEEFGPTSAFEYDEDARAYAAARSKSNIRLGALPGGIDFGSERFDLIVMFDVLEHIEQDRAALERLSQFLAPGGKLIVTVPAFQWLWSRHDELHHHKRRYTRRSLTKTLGLSGLKPVQSGYFNTILFPLAVVDRLLMRLRPGRAASGDVPTTPLNKLLASIFAFERHWTGIWAAPFGLSLYMIAEKRPAP